MAKSKLKLNSKVNATAKDLIKTIETLEARMGQPRHRQKLLTLLKKLNIKPTMTKVMR